MYIGIDIGGSKINSVLVKNNRVVKKRKTLIESKKSKITIVAQIYNCINFLLEDISKKQVKGIGIGVPSPVDFKNQKILNPPNLVGLTNTHLAKQVEKEFKIKTVLDNDSNCFVLAESILGGGKNQQIIAGLTIGTGIGGGVVINKEVFRGKNGSAAEFGHIKIPNKNRKCTCGSFGCLEAYVSAKGMVETAGDVGLRTPTKSKEITQLAKNGNNKAIKAYKITGKYLGLGLSDIVNILNPDILIIGGGISNAGNLLLAPARNTMKENIVSLLAKNTKVIKARLGENAGAIGATLLVKHI